MSVLSSTPHHRLTLAPHGGTVSTTTEPRPPDLTLLTGVDAAGVLDAAVATDGGRVVSWRARDVTHQPGRAVTASYEAKVRWADGRATTELLAAATGDLPDGVLHLDDGTDRVAVWRYPHDPGLPGLPAANDPAAVAALLHDFGLSDAAIRLRVRGYRPRRRAVIEAVGSHGRLFIKAVRPDRVEALHRRHRLLVAAGIPAPASLGWTSDGLLVLQALPGRTLREAIGTAAPPSGQDIVAMLDRLPVELADGHRHRSWLDRVVHYAAVVGAALPDQAERADGVARAIAAEAGTGPTVAVHGDFYESQLLVDGGRICGVLDVDAARLGDRLDDLGCLIGHLSVLAQLDRRRAAAINRLGARYLAIFERTVDPADLRYRAAAVAISLATGPHRVQDARWPATTRRLIALAEQWLHSGRRARRRGG
jgi:aminoglycoside phosphotransferase